MSSDGTRIKPTLLVLAAGMGSRYGGLKQMDAVGTGGEAILDYSIYDALRAGFGNVVVVLRKEIEQAFRETVGRRFEGHVEVEYAFQDIVDIPRGFRLPEGRTKPWGTTHAVLSAAAAIREPFAVINADDFYGAAGYRRMANHLSSGSGEYAMVGYVLRQTLSEFGTVARGICDIDREGLLRGVQELTRIRADGWGTKSEDPIGGVNRLSGDEIVSMNFWGFDPGVFVLLQDSFAEFLEMHGTEMDTECYLPAAVDAMIEAGKARVRVLPAANAWFGVTYREDRARVVAQIGQLIEDGQYPKRLWG